MAGIESTATGNKRDRTKKNQIFDILSSFVLASPARQRGYIMRSNMRQTHGMTTNFVLLSRKLSQIYFLKEIIL
jgi:hypothetical protein